MKGQYLAIETTLTFGMGIAVAIGTISVFSGYTDDIEDSAKTQEAKIVKSKIQSSIFKLKGTDYGRTAVELPEKLGTTEYTVALDDKINIITVDKTLSKSFEALSPGYEYSGTAKGGTVNIYKSGNKFTMRSG